jgi:hypothetical protein
MRHSHLVVLAVLSAYGSVGAVHGREQDSNVILANAPTFNKEVAPILFARCTSCHRPGEIAPMSLLTYEDARAWARSIGKQVALGTMPPWHAESAYGPFVNDRRLTAAEKDTIARWVNAGAPRGRAEDRPSPPTYIDGWQIGQPDLVLGMSEDYPVQAAGTIAYRYFEVPTNLVEDRWIEAIEVRPGNRAVVHHVLVFARPPDEEIRASVFKLAPGMEKPAGQTGGQPLSPDAQRRSGPDDRPAPKRLGPLIAVFTPGQTARVYQSGSALRLPAGTVLTLMIHYAANGTATTDRTKVGFVLASRPPARETRVAVLSNGSLRIPPGASDHRVDAELTVLDDVLLWSLLPHTHLRGKRWEYRLTYPDGRTDTLLTVPRYDFNWQTEYVFKTPVRLPKGTTLRSTAWYDNSSANPANPDPLTEVRWGDQTWEEMQSTTLAYSVERPAASSTADRRPAPRR